MRSKLAFHAAGTIVAACLVGVFSMPLFAAQAGTQADNATVQEDWIEEVVVTADRCTTRLMETPIPASVFSQEELRVAGLPRQYGIRFLKTF